MSVKFPETLVLSITVHGILPIESGTVTRFTVPEGMRIKKISAVTPGVCNVTSEDSMEKANASIRKVFGSPQLKYEEIDPKLTSLIQSLKSIESEMIPTIRGELKSENDMDMRNMLRYTDKGFSTVEYLPGKPMINKEFTRSDGEGIENVDDFKITALNAVGQPDIYSLIVKGRTGATNTRGSTKSEGEYLLTLSTIVTVLQENGVKNILLFDFSCSQMTEVTDREIREKRRDLGKEGLNGGKKTKTRSTRKRKYGHFKTNTHSLFGKQQATRRRKHSRKRPSRTPTNP